MPSFTTTIEDNSPQLIYSAGWVQGVGTSDSLVSQYSSSNFMATNVNGASVTFSFVGTGVQVFGAKRDNHGLFQVTIDGNSFPPVSGLGNEFQSLLFTTTNLKQGPHKMVLTNQEAKFVDIDFISWQSDIGKKDEPLLTNVVQDSDPAFKYSNGWTTNPDRIGTFSGSSGHQASTPGVSFTLEFQGDGVALYGPVGQDFAPFSVQIDGSTATTFSAAREKFDRQTMMFHTLGLGAGRHTLKLTSQATQAGQPLAIDYAIVYGSASLGGVSSSSGVGITQSGLSAAAGAGIAVAVCSLLALAFIAFMFFTRRGRRYRNGSNSGVRPLEKIEGGLVVPEPGTIYVPPPPRRNSSFGHMAPLSSYTFNNLGNSAQIPLSVPSPTASPPPVGSSRDTSESGDGPSLRYQTSRTHLMRVSGTYSIATSNSSNSTSPRAAQAVSAKGRKLYLPATAGQSLSDVPAEELATSRRIVEGRPQDFGAVDPNRYNTNESQVAGPSETLPPPDYSQATEPFAR